jgi:hypothetical protein
MLARFSRLSRVATKILEIAGAACASTLAAILLGNTREPSRPPEQPALVRLAPADEQMIRFVRDEGAALVEQLRNASDARKSSAPVAAPQSSAPKPVKAAAASVPPRREQKPNRIAVIEPKQRPAEPPPAQSMPVSAGEGTQAGSSGAASSERMPPPPSAAGETFPPPSPATQVPLRLWPAAVTTSLPDPPRPPAAVGEFASRSM